MRILSAKLFWVVAHSALLICVPLAQGQNAPWSNKYEKLDVVTVAKPNTRQHCHVKSFDATQLTCSQAFGKTRTYLRSDWVALISPLEDDNRFVALWLGGWLSAGGACIYGAIIAATIPATAGLSVAAFLLVEMGLLGAAFSGNGPYYDAIVYQRPGATLDASLHLKPESGKHITAVP
jgi:hypothetical protein